MDGFKAITVAQSRGPKLKFQGKLLCEDSFVARSDGVRITMRIWQTPLGSLIGETIRESVGEEGGRKFIDAKVVESHGMDYARDQQRMQLAILDHFDWGDRAQAMVRKQLDWSLRREVA